MPFRGRLTPLSEARWGCSWRTVRPPDGIPEIKEGARRQDTGAMGALRAVAMAARANERTAGGSDAAGRHAHAPMDKMLCVVISAGNSRRS